MQQSSKNIEQRRKSSAAAKSVHFENNVGQPSQDKESPLATPGCSQNNQRSSLINTITGTPRLKDVVTYTSQENRIDATVAPQPSASPAPAQYLRERSLAACALQNLEGDPKPKAQARTTTLRRRAVMQADEGIESDRSKFNPRRLRPSTRSKSCRSSIKPSTWTMAPKGMTKARSTPQRNHGRMAAKSSEPSSQVIASLTPEVPSKPRKFVVGIDFGTTYTSVSYFAHDLGDSRPRAFPSDIKTISNWPGDTDGVRKQVPSESWYSGEIKSRRKQFADQDSDDSADDSSTTQIPKKKSTLPRTSQTQPVQTPNTEDNFFGNQQASGYLWGYQVLHEYYDDSTRDPLRRIQRSKSMIVNTNYTQADRQTLRRCLNHLIEEGSIRKFARDQEDPRDVRDAILDFLAEVLKHTYRQLVLHERFDANCVVEFVLTVPVIWSNFASRVMQDAMEAAIAESGFGSLDGLFIITEPEAAATYLGNSATIRPGETFTVLDCGGGTVDCVTYSVANSLPLRLERELCDPSGDNCGGSYLNDNFTQRLLYRLRDEDYLDFNGQTRESIVHHLVPRFEDHQKRTTDIFKTPGQVNSLRIGGLRGDKQTGLSGSAEKRFSDNCLWMHPGDYEAIFLPLLVRVFKVLTEQLGRAIAMGKHPKKVFLIGGFGASPSIHSYLAKHLPLYTKGVGLTYEIELIFPPAGNDSTAIVSSGAVLRALNKLEGPYRLPSSSYGFLRREPYQPNIFRQHRTAEQLVDQLDGVKYVEVIEWFMPKNKHVSATHKFPEFSSTHIFPEDTDHLSCEEIVYVSDTATTSHCGVYHKENKQAQEARCIITDFSEMLKNKEMIPTVDKEEIEGNGHYKIEYNIVFFVKGRDLWYHTIYPADELGTVRTTGQISIAAAFEPGTE